MSVNSKLYLEKYLKYKTKYLKLKELLGGVNPTIFNPKDELSVTRAAIDETNEVMRDLSNIIGNLLADMIIHNICKQYDLNLNSELKGLLETYINVGFFYPRTEIMSNFRETIKNFIYLKISEKMILRETDEKYDSRTRERMRMRIFGFNLPDIKQTEEKFTRTDNNIHISFRQNNQQQKYKSELNYHGTYSYKMDGVGKFESTHYITELEIFNMLKYWYNYISGLTDQKYKYFVIILSILAVNFGKNDDSRNSLDQILDETETNETLNNFINELLKWIDESFSSFISESFTRTVKEAPKDSIDETLKFIRDKAYEISIERKERASKEASEKEKARAEQLIREQERTRKIEREKHNREQFAECEENQRIMRLAVQENARKLELLDIATNLAILKKDYSLIGTKRFLITDDKQLNKINKQSIIDDLIKLHKYFSQPIELKTLKKSVKNKSITLENNKTIINLYLDSNYKL